MSLDLVDLKRLKITPETAAWLEAESRTSGRTKQEILREAMHQLAIEKIHAAKVLSALAPAEGISRDGGGRRR
jgi:predicted DNA-binding protein